MTRSRWGSFWDGSRTSPTSVGPSQLTYFFARCREGVACPHPSGSPGGHSFGRLTALQKANGEVRGIVAGDIVKRLVARTMSQHFMESVQAATAPFQHAMSTKSDCECIAHALQSAIDFGQFRLRPISTSANFDFGQFRLRPISTSADFLDVEFLDHKGEPPKGGARRVVAPKGGGGPNPEKVGPRRLGPRRLGPRRVGPEGWGPEGWRPRRVEAPEGGAPKGRGPKISRFFYLFPPQFLSSFSLFSRGPFVEFWWCLKRGSREMCTFGVLGRAPAAGSGGAAGVLFTTAREPKRAHFMVPAFKNTNKIQRKDPKREKEE